jgi:acetyl esterase/lipase
MPSDQTKMMMQMMKAQPRFNPLPPDGDYEALRNGYYANNARLPLDEGAVFTQGTLGGIEVELTRPKEIKNDAILFYIHGGGFILGTCSSTRSYASYLANSTGLLVYTVSYRLAPEHKAPAAVEDCLTVYEELRKKYPGRKIVLLGESGGGTIALAATLWAKDKGLALPSCLIAFAPCATVAEVLPSRMENDGTDISLSGDGIKIISDLYCGNGDPRHPYTSPAYGDYSGFPPLWVVVDSGEVLSSDSEMVVAAARKVGVDVKYDVVHGLFHTYEVLGKMIPEGKKAMNDTVAFIYKHITPIGN